MKRRLDEPEIKAKWRKAATGRVHSEATKEKMRMVRSKRKLTKSQLKSKLDLIFSKYIRLRDSTLVGDERIGVCITCRKQIGAVGRRTGQAGHFISRRFMSTRYDEKNVHLQCARCNMWGAGEQYLYSIEVDKLYGAGTAQQLHEKANSTIKITEQELIDLIEIYKEKIKDIDKDIPKPPVDVSVFG